MPAPATAALFAVAALALLVVPGPAVLYITTRSAAQGRRAGLVSVLGIHTGTLVHVLAAVAGLSTVLAASAAAFSVVKYAGAAYLIVLGVRAIRRGGAAAGERQQATRSMRRLYVDGFVVNLLNPKTALFFLAFLPQFVHRDGTPVWSQTLALGALFVLLGALSDGAYALAGARVGRWWRSRPRARRRGPLVEGGVLVGLGVLALAVPHKRTA
ncbi:MAG TPA: LysE family translocator [Acidimicrobiales bacterium]|nr:LysE family translocator [Acidimicrobiales bacterium]